MRGIHDSGADMKEFDVANFLLKGFLLSALCFGFLDVWFLNLFYVSDPTFRDILSQVTYLGDSEWMLIGSLGIGCLSYAWFRWLRSRGAEPKIRFKWRVLSHRAAFVFIAVAATGIFASLSKNSIGRARPYLIEEVGPHGFSPFAFDSQWAAWPSGHTTTAFAMATALAILFPKFRYVYFALAVIAGLSRTMLGAHYLADTIMGATIGVAGTILIYRWLRNKMFLTYPRNPRQSQAKSETESDISS